MMIYGLSSCDTCRAARRALAGAQFRDVRDRPLGAAEIARFVDRFGDALVNRRSTTWRGLSEAERTRPAADLLAAHPALMKRPVIRASDGTLYLGWGREVQAALS